MHERNLEPEHPLPRHLVDQVGTVRCELGDRGPYVSHLIGDVVHPRPACGEKPPDGRIAAERREELDPALAHTDRRRLDALIVDAGAMLEPPAEEALIRAHGLVEVGNCDTDMVDPPRFHVGDATAVCRIR